MSHESDASTGDHRFQVDLRGIIDLLSNHLYSGPQVYVRELLQNGTDAIRARLQFEPEHQGEMRLEIVEPQQGPPTLVFQDNGIGLDEQEAHRFLATIGQSSKRGDLAIRDDFIGQFGVGLLSCFLVCDEIVVITRSARVRGPAIEWRGKADGTYSVRALDQDSSPGTQVFLRCKPGREEFFQPERVRELATRYGGMLPYPILLSSDRGSETLNQTPPWEFDWENDPQQREALMALGTKTFEVQFLDCLPLRSKSGDVQGVAFVLPFPASPASKRTHQAYLKRMLLTEQADNLLPDWAFFVQCVANTNSLRPTASRESFYEDGVLESAREELGDCLREYLMQLARKAPQRLERLISLHHLSIKALALEDEECYRTFADFLPFETSIGQMTLGHFRQEYPVVRYVAKHDQFRQIAHVAAAQSMGIVNAGYVYDTEILERLPQVFPESQVERLDVDAISERFEELSLDERDSLFDFQQQAEEVLRPYGCDVQLKKFRPAETPALYLINDAADFLRSVEKSKEVSNPLWSSVLDGVAADAASVASASLCLNFNNALTRRIARLDDPDAQRRTIEMIYVQALLLGHYPLKTRETRLLNEGLLGLIEWGLDSRGEQP